VYTWCAWDALFIPRVIGRQAQVASHCPITSAPIRLVVAPDGVLEASPLDITVSFLLGCEPGADQGIVGACCPHIHFLSTAAAADRWLSSHPAGLALTLGEAWQSGRLFVDDVLFGATTR
jgi:alkylmercury lyase